MFNPRPVTSPKTKPRCRGAFCFAAVLPSPLWDHKGGGSRPACRTRWSRNAWTRAPSRLGAEPHSPVLFTCQTALLNAPPHTAAAKVSSFVLEARECRTLGVFPPPPAAELGFTRVRPLINWPKSDKSDFGWRVREGAGNMICACMPRVRRSSSVDTNGPKSAHQQTTSASSRQRAHRQAHRAATARRRARRISDRAAAGRASDRRAPSCRL